MGWLCDFAAAPRLRGLALLVAALGHGVVIAALANLPSGEVAIQAPSVLAVKWVGEDKPAPAPPEPQVKPRPLPMKPKRQTTPMQPQPRSEPAQLAAAPAEAPAEAAPMIAAAPPAAGRSEPEPAPVVAPRFDADYLSNPAPVYPPASRAMGEQGKVFLRVFVSAHGEAQSVELRTSCGHARLDEAAIDAVRRWKFVPARQGNDTVAAWVIVPISFTLRR
jgi:periplasmic protein TonB